MLAESNVLTIGENKDKKYRRGRSRSKIKYSETSEGVFKVTQCFPDETVGTFQITYDEIKNLPDRVLTFYVLIAALDIASKPSKKRGMQGPLIAENFQERLSRFRDLDINEFLEENGSKDGSTKDKLKEENERLKAKMNDLEDKLKLVLALTKE